MEKRIPRRKCIACGKVTDKANLIRMVRGKDGTVTPDPGGRLPGRGLYICNTEECQKLARKKKRI